VKTKPKPKQRTTADAQREREESGEIGFQLIRAKLDDIKIVDNVSRHNIEHEYYEVVALADKIVKNNFWDPPHVSKNRHGKLELIDGHMRIMAARLLFEEGRFPKAHGDENGVQILIIKRTAAERDAMNMATTVVKKGQTNYQRAHALYTLQQRHGHTAKQLGEQYGLDHRSVSNYIRAARDLHPTIQKAWCNYETGDMAMSLTQLIAWASLLPDDQLAAFQSSKWAAIYAIAEKQKKSSNTHIITQPKEVIQYAYEQAVNPIVKHTLEWVLRLRVDLDGKQYDSGNDRRANSRRESSNPNAASNPSSTPPRRGQRATDKDSSLLWEDESGEPNSSPDSTQRASNGKSRIDVDNIEDIDAGDLAQLPPYVKRTSRSSGRN
jgi:ParB-like nuclease domain.